MTENWASQAIAGSLRVYSASQFNIPPDDGLAFNPEDVAVKTVFIIDEVCCNKMHYYYYLLQLNFHSVAVVLIQVTNKNKHYINETIQKHSKYMYTCYQNTHTVVKTSTQNPHVHTPTHYKTQTYTHPHITKPTQLLKTHTLQNKLINNRSVRYTPNKIVTV